MTFEIILYTGKKYADGSYPISLKFTNRGERKIKIAEKGFAIHEEDWNDEARRPKTVKKTHLKYEEFKKFRLKLNDLDSAYTKEIDKLEEKGRRISIDQLIRRVENPIENMSVFNYFDRVIRQEGGGHYGHSKTFVTCLQRIKSFAKNKDLEFHTINLRWLNDWRDNMKTRSMSDATLSIYFRSLRTVYNKAIGEGYCDKRDYPFGKKNDNTRFTISQFKANPNKRSISQDDIQLIKSLDLSNVDQIRRKDKFDKAVRSLYREDLETAQTIFLFSYYAVGMNYNDIARLTWNDVDMKEQTFDYVRTKTGKSMSVDIHPYNMAVLEFQHLITGNNSDNFVFDILHRSVQHNELKIRGRIHRQMRLVNESLKEIQKLTGITTELTTYVARHSAITHMIRNGIELDTVQEVAGHSNITTTLGYAAKVKRKEKSKAVNSLS